MYLWQRLAALSWWATNEECIRVEGGEDLAIIERPGRKRLMLEISCRTRSGANSLRRRFGGSVTKLPADWLKRFARAQETGPLNIGKRLVVSNADGSLASRRPPSSGFGVAGQGRSHIIIPAGAAFGTGQHATTAMSLRMLEELTREWSSGWSMADLGTGSGILAVSAKRLGARRVIAIDVDPVAISTAKGNARLNRTEGIRYQVSDVRKRRLPAGVSVVTANLFSDLLIEVMPKLRRIPWLILSGVMRDQEREVKVALKRNKIHVVKTRRRGKWIAVLGKTG